MMMSALSTKPSKSAEKTCHVWGLRSTKWNESFLTICRDDVVPSAFCTVTVSRMNSPAGINHVETAERRISAKTMVKVCGIFFTRNGVF